LKISHTRTENVNQIDSNRNLDKNYESSNNVISKNGELRLDTEAVPLITEGP
jgi:hypothetical protein